MHSALMYALLTAHGAGVSSVAVPPAFHPDSACPSRNVPVAGRKSEGVETVREIVRDHCDGDRESDRVARVEAQRNAHAVEQAVLGTR